MSMVIAAAVLLFVGDVAVCGVFAVDVDDDDAGDDCVFDADDVEGAG